MECKHGLRLESCVYCLSKPASGMQKMCSQSQVILRGIASSREERGVEVYVKPRPSSWGTIPAMSILPYWKYCIRCGKCVRRQGNVVQWARWRLCLSCRVGGESNFLVHCMYCGISFGRYGTKKALAWCGGCRKWEHCLSVSFPTDVQDQ